MTFKTYVTDQKGVPIPDLFIQANDENNGLSFTRSTDGGGYADVAMLGSCKLGDRVTFVVLDPSLRFSGYVIGDGLVIGDADQTIRVQLIPFV